MQDELRQIVYSKNVVEFVTVAREYCAFVENTNSFEKHDFIDKTLKLLSLLYLKALVLPRIEQVNEEGNEKFVTELDWQYIRNGIEQILGDDDAYIDFFDEEMKETPEPVTATISENLADVYQDLQDFLGIYQLGRLDLMNDAIYECQVNFENYWGARTVNSIRVLHRVYFHITKSLDDRKEANDKPADQHNLSNWFTGNKAKRDFQSND